MKAGRELDVLIVEKVMEWKYDQGYFERHGWFQLREDEAVIFKPSERIEDAWLVVEKLKESGLQVVIITDRHTKNDCTVEIYEYSVPIQLAEVEAETAPLAICLAALKAVGVEVG